MIKKQKIKNELLQKYISVSTHHVICVDVTVLGNSGELFLAVDLAARNIVGHCYTNKRITTKDVCDTINEFYHNRKFLPQINIIHSDKGSIFTNDQFKQYLDFLDITPSQGDSRANQNQVIERLNRTLKDIIRKNINNDWKKGMNDPLKYNTLNTQEFAKIIHKSIEFYNDREHSTLFGLSPNQMEDALFDAHGNKHPKNLELLALNNNSPESTMINQYKAIIAQKYKGNWEQFFIEWRIEQQKGQQELVREVKQQKEEFLKTIKEQKETFQTQYQSLYQQYLEVQKELKFVHDQAVEDLKEKQRKQELKNKRKNAKKQPLRDIITPEDFELIKSLVKGSSFVKERRIVALTILYLTGLRVSNLLLFSVKNIKELFEKGRTHISLIKGGEKRHPIRLSNQGHQILSAIKDDCSFLFKGKNDNDLLFTPLNYFNKPMQREFFDKELNDILKQASNQLGKFIRTHSFRATLITDLLQTTPIDQVKELIGHRSIASTIEYKRSTLTNKQAIQILKKRELKPVTQNKKRGRPRIIENE